jgi:hypothetical protein
MLADREDLERCEKARGLLLKKNKRARDAVDSNNVSKMDKIFRAGGIKQDAIDLLIFCVKSVEMMKIFLRYGGNLHKLGPPLHPDPRTLLSDCTASRSMLPILS